MVEESLVEESLEDGSLEDGSLCLVEGREYCVVWICTVNAESRESIEIHAYIVSRNFVAFLWQTTVYLVMYLDIFMRVCLT